MAASNFLQFNPAQINQETDATYGADSQRTGGFGTDSIVPSPLLNKVLYQASTFIAAFGQMLAAKGLDSSDADINVLATVLANLLTSADQLPNIIVQPYSPTPVFNASTANGFQMTLVGNVGSSMITRVAPGQTVAFYFLQDATGGRTVGWPAGMVGTQQPDPAPNAFSLLLFRADLSGTLRAIAPLVSNNGVFLGNLTASGFSLGASPAGSILVGSGSAYVPRTLTGADNTSTRAFGTVYQNTTGAEIEVCVTAQTGSGGGAMSALIGQASPPSFTVISQSRVPAASSDPIERVGMTFKVPPGWYYSAGSFRLDLVIWFEYFYV